MIGGSSLGGSSSCYCTHMALVSAICSALIDGESKNLRVANRVMGGGGRAKEKEKSKTKLLVFLLFLILTPPLQIDGAFK